MFALKNNNKEDNHWQFAGNWQGKFTPESQTVEEEH